MAKGKEHTRAQKVAVQWARAILDEPPGSAEIGRRNTARIANALVAYAALHPDGMPPHMLDYLHPSPES